MADERTKLAAQARASCPSDTRWPTPARPRRRRAGGPLPPHPRGAGPEPAACSASIFRKAQNQIQDPAKLKRLIVDLIDKENWSALGTDVKGDAYEGLLEQERRRTPSPAPASTSRRAPLIGAIVDVRAARSPARRSVDPACGTGGFLLAAHEHVARHAADARPRRRRGTCATTLVRGFELVDGTARLCAMNLLLHGIGDADDGEPLDRRSTTPSSPTPATRCDVVLTNPPFGRKSSLTIVNAEGERPARGPDDRPRRTSGPRPRNKQLNFVQHITTILEHQRPRRRRRARQRALRGRRRRDDAAQAAARLRRAHAAAAADRHLLRPGREGQRALLRQAARRATALDASASGSTTCAPTSTSR